jgi:hypothetical protein
MTPGNEGQGPDPDPSQALTEARLLEQEVARLREVLETEREAATRDMAAGAAELAQLDAARRWDRPPGLELLDVGDEALCAGVGQANRLVRRPPLRKDRENRQLLFCGEEQALLLALLGELVRALLGGRLAGRSEGRYRRPAADHDLGRLEPRLARDRLLHRITLDEPGVHLRARRKGVDLSLHIEQRRAPGVDEDLRRRRAELDPTGLEAWWERDLERDGVSDEPRDDPAEGDP